MSEKIFHIKRRKTTIRDAAKNKLKQQMLKHTQKLNVVVAYFSFHFVDHLRTQLSRGNLKSYNRMCHMM